MNTRFIYNYRTHTRRKKSAVRSLGKTSFNVKKKMKKWKKSCSRETRIAITLINFQYWVIKHFNAVCYLNSKYKRDKKRHVLLNFMWKTWNYVRSILFRRINTRYRKFDGVGLVTFKLQFKTLTDSIEIKKLDVSHLYTGI